MALRSSPPRPDEAGASRPKERPPRRRCMRRARGRFRPLGRNRRSGPLVAPAALPSKAIVPILAVSAARSKREPIKVIKAEGRHDLSGTPVPRYDRPDRYGLVLASAVGPILAQVAIGIGDPNALFESGTLPERAETRPCKAEPRLKGTFEGHVRRPAMQGQTSGCVDGQQRPNGPDPRAGDDRFRVNAHFHFHVCVIDGVFSEDAEGSVQFHEAIHLTASDWDELQHTVRHRGAPVLPPPGSARTPRHRRHAQLASLR